MVGGCPLFTEEKYVFVSELGIIDVRVEDFESWD